MSRNRAAGWGGRVCAAAVLMAGLTLAASPGARLAAQVALRPELLLQFSEELFRAGRYDDAIDGYRLALGDASPVVERQARIGLVRSLLRTGEFTDAGVEATRLRALAAQTADSIATVGDALWAGGLFDESEAAYKDALTIDQASGRAHHGLGRSLASWNRLDEAEREVVTAIAAAPLEGDFNHTLGMIYERERRYDQAAAAFERYLATLPQQGKSLKRYWTLSEIKFLRSFGNNKPLDAAESVESVAHTFDFKMRNGKVTVPVELNGSERSDFVVDTGAEATVITRRLARDLGVSPMIYTITAGVGEEGLRGIQVGRLRSLRLGDLKISNVPVLIQDRPGHGGNSLSPLALGLSMTIDYSTRKLTVSRRPFDTGDYDYDMPLRINRLAMMRGTVNHDRPAYFVVDTGGEVISISLAMATALGQNPARKIRLKVIGTSGWDKDAFLLPGVDLAFQQIRYDHTPVVVLNLNAPSVLLGFQLGGIVGHNFLSHYRVSFDLDHSRLRLKQLAPSSSPPS